MRRYLGLSWKFLTFLEIETMEILLVLTGFTLGCSFGCGMVLWGLMDDFATKLDDIRRGDD
jgi:hypothetical protein